MRFKHSVFGNSDDDQLISAKNELNEALAAHEDATVLATIMERTRRILDEKKLSLKPLNEQVKNMRVESARLLNERAERKAQYDTLQEQLETTSAALESNVQGLRRSAAQEAERYYKIDTELVSKEVIVCVKKGS